MYGYCIYCTVPIKTRVTNWTSFKTEKCREVCYLLQAAKTQNLIYTLLSSRKPTLNCMFEDFIKTRVNVTVYISLYI